MKISISTAMLCVRRALDAGLVPLVLGSPGTGKSASIHAIAKERNLKLIDVRTGTIDPCELDGYLMPSEGKISYLVPDIFPTEDTPIPEGYSGWMIFFDEIPSAPKAVQNALYKVLLDRKVAQHNLHEKVEMCCAGNYTTDGAISHKLSTALQSRLVTLQIDLHSGYTEFNQYGLETGMDYRILNYLAYDPSKMNQFNPKHMDVTFACQRTWDFTSKLIKGLDIVQEGTTPLLSGVIGEGAAREFIGYCKIYNELPTIEEIVSNPHRTAITEKVDRLYALSGWLSNGINPSNSEQLFKYIDRLPREYQGLTAKLMVSSDNLSVDDIHLSKWIDKNLDLFV